MAYTVLARRYRSRSFDQVVGQEPIAQTLRNAIELIMEPLRRLPENCCATQGGFPRVFKPRVSSSLPEAVTAPTRAQAPAVTDSPSSGVCWSGGHGPDI